MTQTVETIPIQSPIEARVARLEAEVAELKLQVKQQPPSRGWLDKVIGSADDMSQEDFDEVVRLGREARQAQPPLDEVPG